MAFDYSNRKFLQKKTNSSTRESNFNEGDIIFKKGERGQIMYEVESGGVGIYLDYKGPNEKLLVKKLAGEYFGEIALIEDRPRTATAVAIYDKTKLKEISVNGFPIYAQQNPNILKPIMDAMSDRFKMQRKVYFEVCRDFAEYKNAVDHDLEPDYELLQKIDKYIKDAEKFQYRDDIF